MGPLLIPIMGIKGLRRSTSQAYITLACFCKQEVVAFSISEFNTYLGKYSMLVIFWSLQLQVSSIHNLFFCSWDWHLALWIPYFDLRFQSSLRFPDDGFAFLFLGLLVDFGYFISEKRNVDSIILELEVPFFVYEQSFFIILYSSFHSEPRTHLVLFSYVENSFTKESSNVLPLR